MVPCVLIWFVFCIVVTTIFVLFLLSGVHLGEVSPRVDDLNLG